MNKRLATIILTSIFLLTGLSGHAAAGDSKTEDKTEDRLGESPVDPDVPNPPAEPTEPTEPKPDLPDEKEPKSLIGSWITIDGVAIPFTLNVDYFNFYAPAGDLGENPGGEDRR